MNKMKFVKDGIEVSTTVDLPIIGTREIREVIKYDEFKGKLLISNISVNRNEVGGIADISFNAENPTTATAPVQTVLVTPEVHTRVHVKPVVDYPALRRAKLLEGTVKICDFQSITRKPYTLYLSADKTHYVITGRKPHTYVNSFEEYLRFIRDMPPGPMNQGFLIGYMRKRGFSDTDSWALPYIGVALNTIIVRNGVGRRRYFEKK